MTDDTQASASTSSDTGASAPAETQTGSAPIDSTAATVGEQAVAAALQEAGNAKGFPNLASLSPTPAPVVEPPAPVAAAEPVPSGMARADAFALARAGHQIRHVSWPEGFWMSVGYRDGIEVAVAPLQQQDEALGAEDGWILVK